MKKSAADYYKTWNSIIRDGVFAIATYWKPYGCNVAELVDAQQPVTSTGIGYVVDLPSDVLPLLLSNCIYIYIYIYIYICGHVDK